MVQDYLLNELQTHFRHKIVDVETVSGGDISKAFKIELANRSRFFIKFNSEGFASDLLTSEQIGLTHIKESNTLSVPEIIGFKASDQYSYLILEWIDSKEPNTQDWESFGMLLAEMHQCNSGYFGGVPDNYIGSLPQHNSSETDWVKFYATYRLDVQFQLALHQNLLSPREVPKLKVLIQKLQSIIPSTKASLLHGDLWGGNFLTALNGTTYLIDPSVYYGDGIIDIAMSQLFGGFDTSFFDSYFYWSPPKDALQERIELYQLYYLLVHLNLFGKSYYQSVQRILKRYL